jgi:hypothetical protein
MTKYLLLAIIIVIGSVPSFFLSKWATEWVLRGRKPKSIPVPAPVACKDCGHTRDDHSPCSPMGCTKCDCWRTPLWVDRQ